MRAIGIDLGTTNSVAAVVDGDRPRALANRNNEPLTPSVVSYVKRRGADTGEIVVGRAAANNAVRDPTNTIFSIKRLMGRQYGEARVEEVQKRYGFQLAPAPSADSDDHGVKVMLNGKPQTPVEISAMILKQIKADAEFALGEEVTHAVITVPAYFEERQRHATTAAGKLAGLTVLEIIDEPTAAALAFGLGKEDERHRVLVYDLGGGTFDISLIQMYKHDYSVLEIQGDNWLGGDDFDQMIVRRMIETIKSEHAVDPSSRPGFLMQAKTEAEAAKKALGAQMRTEILWSVKVPEVGMIDLEMELTRETFEADIHDRIAHTVDLVHTALKNRGLNASNITAVLLVGGSTAIPLVHKMLAEVFGEGKLRRDVNPMECVALGAAIRADRFELSESADAATQKAGLKGGISTVTPLDLGIAAVEDDNKDKFAPIIKKGTPYPLKEPISRTFYPSEANMKMLRIPVYEGLDPQASLNELQGVLEFALPEAISRSQPIEIAFNYDRDRVVTVLVNIVGKGKLPSQQLNHKTARRSARRDAPEGDGSLKDDWREELSPTIRMGKVFDQGYGLYMSGDDRKELQTALLQAEEALKAGNETEGKRQQLVIDNKIMGSGLASLMYIAESVMQRANAKQARVLAQAIAALRQAHAQGANAQTERLVQDVRVVIADIFNARSAAPEVVEEKYDNLVRILGDKR